MAGVLAALVVVVPSRASAWTEANVVSARAEVRVDRDASAHVTLVCMVQIHGGWLEGLDITELDPDLLLDPERPPWVRDANGTELTPRIEVSGGRIGISFRRRDAPRRGTLEVGIAYRTSLAHRATEVRPDGRVRVHWTMPAWRSGLDGVTIEMVVPSGAVAAELEEDRLVAVDVTRSHAGGETRVKWRRVHLPRTVAWTVAVDIPAAEMHADLIAPRHLAASDSDSSSVSDSVSDSVSVPATEPPRARPRGTLPRTAPRPPT